MVASDASPLQVTVGPSAPATVGPAGTTDVLTGLSTSPFTMADFNAGDFLKSFRVVSVGLRIRYTGTQLEKSGRVFTIQMHPRKQDADLIGIGINDLERFGSYKESSFSNNKWHSVIRLIQSPADYMFQSIKNGNCLTYNITKEGTNCSFDQLNTMGIFIQAQPGISFEVEASAHFEICGPNLNFRQQVQANPTFVEALSDAFHTKRYKDKTTKDHSVGIHPKESGGWVSVLKEGAKALLPMVPQVLSMFL
jgi:hypothetical protein